MKSGGSIDLPKLFSLSVMALAALSLLATVNWRIISTFLVASDLQEHAEAVRRSSVSLADKEQLLSVIEDLEDRLDAGQRPNWWRWQRHDRTINRLLKAGLDEDEARLLEREFYRAGTKCWENDR